MGWSRQRSAPNSLALASSATAEQTMIGVSVLVSSVIRVCAAFKCSVDRKMIAFGFISVISCAEVITGTIAKAHSLCSTNLPSRYLNAASFPTSRMVRLVFRFILLSIQHRHYMEFKMGVLASRQDIFEDSRDF